MNNPAVMLDSQGKYREVEAIHRETLQLREKVLGKERLSILHSINNLVVVLESQGKYKEAEAIH